MKESLLKVENLLKNYGDFYAVNGISFSVKPGEIFALLGNNGAGKTTTIKMITGQVRPTGGKVVVGGKDAWENRRQRKLIGYVPDEPILHEELTAGQMLIYTGGLYGVPHRDLLYRADEILCMLGLEEVKNKQIKHFSLGMKKKVSIGLALIHRPKILLLDEVTNGLDPKTSRGVKDMIKKLAGEGCSILLTTHILEVVEEIADTIAILHNGHLRESGSIHELRQMTNQPTADLEEIFLSLTS